MLAMEEMVTFAMVVEKGNFTRVAAVLGVPKSTVSRRVTRLEERLGQQLLLRSTRKLVLTDAGRLYQHHCLRLTETLEEAEQAMVQLHSQPKGKLRISAPVSLGEQTVVPLVQDFLNTYGEISVELLLTDRNVDLIEEAMDAAFRMGPLGDSSLVARRIMRDEQLLVAAPAYLSRRQVPRHPDDLANHVCIHYGRPDKSWPWPLITEKGPIHFKPSSRFVANSLSAVLAMVVAGFGISMLPRFICQEALKDGCLVSLLRDHLPDAQDYYLVHPAQRLPASKLRAFKNHALQWFEKRTPS